MAEENATKTRKMAAAAFLLIAILFWISNRAAAKGYFSDDDLDNLSWTVHLKPADWVTGFITPVFNRSNFRPTGHLFYAVLGGTAGLDFAPYIRAIHLIHLINVLLLSLLLHRLGAGAKGILAGAAFFAFHMACFDAYWKPMYVFDLLAALFTLSTLILYTSSRWWLGLFTFWLAFKSKELAAAVPLFLVAFEHWTGSRRWVRVLPFAAISGLFVIQALASNTGIQDSYTLQFSAEALLAALGFYSSKVFLLPWAGLVLIPVYAVSKDPMVRLGISGTVILLGPLWFLPERLYSVYLYLPLASAAIALAFASARIQTACLVTFFLLWIPSNYLILRRQRNVALQQADETRAFVGQMAAAVAPMPPFELAVADTRPAGLNIWGVEGALKWITRNNRIAAKDTSSYETIRAVQASGGALVLSWDSTARKLAAHHTALGKPGAGFIDMRRAVPVWLLGEGWLGTTEGPRWTGPRAAATLTVPPGARGFELTINLGPEQLARQGGVTVEPIIGRISLGAARITTAGISTHRWSLPAVPRGESLVELVFPAPLVTGSGERLGGAIISFGFVE